MSDFKLLPIFKTIKNKWLVILLSAVGILLLLIGSGRFNSGGKSDANVKIDESGGADISAYTQYLEQRITDICGRVHGVSEVSVLLTLDGGSEYVYAENKGGSNVDYLIINDGTGGEKTVLLREIFSRVRGIAVVCNGGSDITVKRTLSELLSCAFGIPQNKISVAGTDK